MPTLILDPKPDVIIVNSCLWDLTRYGPRGGVESYKDSLKRLLDEMKANMPPETLFIWNTTLPLRCALKESLFVVSVCLFIDLIYRLLCVHFYGIHDFEI